MRIEFDLSIKDSSCVLSWTYVRMFVVLSSFMFAFGIFAGGGSKSNDVAKIDDSGSKSNPQETLDIISWKPLTVDNLRTSFKANRWLLIDMEQLGIFQVQRGWLDYRRSTKIKEMLDAGDFDCYYFFLENSCQDDTEDIFGLLNPQLQNLEVDDGSFGLIANFRLRKIYQFEKGTEKEVLQILERIKEQAEEE